MKRILRFFYGLTALFLVVGAVQTQAAQGGFGTPFSKRLEQALQQDAGVKQNPGMRRFAWMRFYVLNNQVHPEPGFWDKFKGCDTDVLIRAYAIYLYNMYISTACYREDVPAQLTVDYTGVLDGFSRCANGFKAEKSVSFYKKHQAEIQQRLKTFFETIKKVDYQVQDPANQRREIAFLKVLEHSFLVYGKMPAYRVDGASRLKAAQTVPQADLLRKLLNASLQEGQDKVVLFEMREAFGSQIDSPLLSGRAKKTDLCRKANEECGACSYLFGREVCVQKANQTAELKSARVYQITAYPTKGSLKTAALKDRFTLANGKKALPWDYHTATLVIMSAGGKYTPYIVDWLLAGRQPVAPNQWFEKFALPQTVFVITPYRREKMIEKKLKIQLAANEFLDAYF